MFPLMHLEVKNRTQWVWSILGDSETDSETVDRTTIKGSYRAVTARAALIWVTMLMSVHRKEESKN